MNRKIKELGTETSYGFIPHFKYGEYLFPVLLEVGNRKIALDEREKPIPAFENELLLFAIPGKGYAISAITQFQLRINCIRNARK